MARRASYVDSVKASYSQILLVDNGGFFPEIDAEQDKSWFLMDAMKLLGTDAVGVGERDLHFGLAFLRGHIKRTGLPVISSNLLDKKTGKPALVPYVVKKVGTVKVGVFSLIGDKVNLGPAHDSLQVAEPAATAKKMVAELKGKGATVIVLLSQLGKVESEDLVSAVEGVDAVMVGHDSPMLQKGRMIKTSVACYGGEQGQYVCRTDLVLDAKRRQATGESETVLLGPEVGEKPEVAKLVKSFEDGFNEKLRKAEAERATKQQANKAAQNDPEHYLGAELCVRCHQAEGEQWKTTSHSMAWQTLITAKKDATPECIGCHVVGYKQSGGFQSGVATPLLTNVQCENCHGMGTKHDAFGTTNQVTEQVCITCHHGENDPEFNFEKKLPMVAHGNTSGETIQRKKSKPPGAPMMGGHGGSR